ncbi:SMP-30/gluconolactonase/LRE family protein [Mucilaginibacter litoreus]|uniref:SMP-30/gluconolactonase/LRE family protein n=1 Tax=Mucilaginibacter litoreus TaxID=1048221 RepID=A0ABW3ASD3_9SPHI
MLTAYEGKLFNGPNDLWIDQKDNIYFTDPYYQRDYWARTKPDLSKQSVYVLLKGKSKPVLLDSTLKQPNGIVGSPDGKTLYVADIGDGKIYKYAINPNGLLSDRQLFFNKGADGITLDERGNLYLAGNGVTVINTKGQEIAHIDIPEPWTSNLCFGGKNRDKLFITASKAVYIMQMNVKGVE